MFKIVAESQAAARERLLKEVRREAADHRQHFMDTLESEPPPGVQEALKRVGLTVEEVRAEARKYFSQFKE
jgi:hypothetical protein